MNSKSISSRSKIVFVDDDSLERGTVTLHKFNKSVTDQKLASIHNLIRSEKPDA